MKRKWLAWLGFALVLACSVYFARQVMLLLTTSDVDIRSSLHLFPAAICTYMAAYLAFGFGWHKLLSATGKDSRYVLDLGIFTTSQFAKYLPGNVGHHVGRVVLAARYGYSSYYVVVTMFVELAMVLGIMMISSIPYIGYWSDKLGLDTLTLGYSTAGLAMVAAVSLMAGFKFRRHPRLDGLMAALRGMSSHKARSALRISTAFISIALAVVLTAVSLGMLDGSSTLLSTASFPALLGVFAASWVLGFLVPGAPAGIGVRELILIEGLAPFIGRDQSVLIALLFRILSTTSDLLAFALGTGILWLEKSNRTA